MTQFAALAVNGLSIGAIYALVAMGLVIIYKATHVLNFAHPALLVLGTYIVATLNLRWDVPFWAAALVAVVVTAGVAMLIDRLLIRRFTERDAAVAASIMTIGLSIVIETEVDRRIGSRILSTNDPWGDSLVSLGSLQLPAARLAALLIGLTLLVIFYAWLQRSDFGIAMRAAADDPETASLMGVRLGRVSAVAWAVAGALAVVAGIFIVAYPSPGLDLTVTGVALRAVPAAIIGGLDSTTGAIAGGLIVGVSEVMARGYQEEILFLGRGFAEVMPYVVMLLVLLVRPAGLFGTKEASRV